MYTNLNIPTQKTSLTTIFPNSESCCQSIAYVKNVSTELRLLQSLGTLLQRRSICTKKYYRQKG